MRHLLYQQSTGTSSERINTTRILECYGLVQIWTCLLLTLLSQYTMSSSCPMSCSDEIASSQSFFKIGFCSIPSLFLKKEIYTIVTRINMYSYERNVTLAHMSTNYYSQCLWSTLLIVCLPSTPLPTESIASTFFF